MIRPVAIRRFGLLWWASFAAWLGALALAWQRNEYKMQQTLADPRAAGAVHLVQPLTVILVFLVTVLIWSAVRRASGVGRWAAAIIAGLAALRLVVAVLGEMSVGFPAPVTTALQALATILDVAAVAQLFGDDARGWFSPLSDGAAKEVTD